MLVPSTHRNLDNFLRRKNMAAIMPIAQIERRIYPIRGVKTMLGHDLAYLYGVEARALIQAVKRNIDRFPADFLFQLTEEGV